jgi:hypothetical protein
MKRVRGRLSWGRALGWLVLLVICAGAGATLWGREAMHRRVRASGYRGERGGEQLYLVARVMEGGRFGRVAETLPRGARRSYHLLGGPGHAALVERFDYGLGGARVDVYYDRAGRVTDTYVDSHPSLAGGRRVTERLARRWLRPK